MWLKFLLISVFGCPSILTTSFDLGGVISGNRMAGIPLGRTLGEGEVDIEGICTESGVACQNCTHAITCIPLPVGFLKIPLEKCRNDKTCNARLGGCSSSSVPECDVLTQKYQHTCEQVGIFPDAYDCRKFHLCSPPLGSPDGSPADHRVGLCPRNYGYNPRTAQCSIKLHKDQCTEQLVPGCSKVGDFGVLPSSPNHYYVCLNKRGAIYPQVFICPHGWFFWDGFCRPEPQGPTTMIPPTTSTTTTSTTEKVITEKFTSSWIDSFFSTEKPTTVKQDTFLADKFDLKNYESYDPSETFNAQTNDDEINSWEAYD